MAVNSSVRMATDQNGNPIYPGFQVGVGAPTHTPSAYGQEYEDTKTGDWYKSSGVSGPWNWNLIKRLNINAFTKDTVANLKIWYRADLGVTKDANNYVSAVINQANNSYANLVGTSNPLWVDKGINNQNAFYFNGTATMQLSPPAEITAITQPHTVYAVWKPTKWDTGVNQHIYELKSDTPYLVISKQNTTTKFIANAGAGDVVYGDLVNNTTYISRILANGASSSIAINNGTPLVCNLGTKTITWPVIGQGSANLVPYSGYFSELLAFESNVSTSDDSIIMAYLNNRYGAY